MVAAGAGYMLADAEPRPNGGTWYGYLLGSIGLLLVLWLALLGVRKRRMSRGRWSLKGWTSAHVYLGLALVVIATLHTGFQLGWNVHSLAWGLMMLVVLSGLWGAAAYAVLPAALSESRSGMTRPQMLDLIAKLDRQLAIAAQPLGAEESRLVDAAVRDDPFTAGLWSRLSGHDRRCRTARALAMFRRRGWDEPVTLLLERKCAVLGQIRRHLRIKALLEIWLYVHVPLTFALIASLAAHVFSVFFYW